MTEIIEHELGVHLNQRHTDYLQDVGLGYSSIKDLFLSPVEWWETSPYNPLRPDEDSADEKKAFLRGEALHTFVLDGQKLYEKVWAVRPTRRSHPGALDTVKELQEACALYGLEHRGSKPELIYRLATARDAAVKAAKARKATKAEKQRAADLLSTEILAELQQRFDDSGRRPIEQKDDFRIRMLHRMMMRTPVDLRLERGDEATIAQLLDKALTEVSIYWVDENGIRQRARFDGLKPVVTLDLKSITQWKKSDFKKSLLSEVILRGYMIQAAHYFEARKQLRIAVAEGRVFGGNKTQRKLLERIARSDYWAWVFLFAKMDGAAQVKAIVIHPDSGQFVKAQQQREEALGNFLYHREFHGGVDRPWFDPEVVWEPAEEEWPMFSVLGQS